MTPIRIGSWFQGPTGSGQGGWTAHRFIERVAERTDEPLTVAIAATIPLDTDLHVIESDDLTDETRQWELVAPDGTAIMIASTWEPAFSDTSPVTIEEARAARHRFLETVDEHPVPSCFSCGQLPDSMGVHAGPLDPSLGDRFATDWTVPDWAVRDDGNVDPGVLWAAIDCCAAWWVGWSRSRRVALTVQYAVEQRHPLEPGATYALVGWSGDHDPEWDGRKRHAASAAFDADGRCVARSASFWVSID
jgi:hypothetical protein